MIELEHAPAIEAPDWTDAQAVCDYINSRWDEAECDERSELFGVAQGLYWYCSDYYGGQNSAEYSIMSAQLDYTPGCGEEGPECGLSRDVYEALEGDQ